jgi:pseudouridine synthase
MAEDRLQKLLARAGYGSRRSCETLIKRGRVTVNGERATLGDKADPTKDTIRVDGDVVVFDADPIYVMYHKPTGVISDEDVAGEYPAARDAIPLEGHLFPVGRLDVESEGLMLFTNDGDLAHKLTHPSYHHPKRYHVWVAGSPTERALEAWRYGIKIGGKRTKAAHIERLGTGSDGTQLAITLTEGRKRQIRRVATQLGYPVARLKRVGLGPLELGDLPSGAWRKLTADEINALGRIRRSGRRKR